MSRSKPRTTKPVLGEDLDTLARSGAPRRFRAGEVIFSAGDAGDGFYIVESGRVKISAPVGGNELRQLASIGAGDFFGEMAVLDDAPRSATATAEVATSTFFVGRDQLLALLESRPPLALNLIREFSVRMRALNRKYLDEIIHAERLSIVGRFASTIVHDFKNPLAVISLAAEASASTDLPEPTRLAAQKQIERQIHRMSNMLNELIDFTRPTKRAANFEAVDFADYLRDLAQELQHDVAGREVTVVLANPPPSVEVQLQPTRYSRLFYNLVNNAVDAMPDGGKVFLRSTVDGA
ncbi:MAG TPA: cyclic nucleotide-binding domain-containing protein, partial [Opitutus sp.]|nr:cyclic nucleotide-binding domain-containing protein [Opitutus sp.]